MPFDDVYLVTPNRDTASPEQVVEAERLLGTRFPTGYGDFVTRFGVGDYCMFVRVYPPGRIAAENHEFQQRWSEYFFWDAGREVLARERVVESVIVADTLQGDELIFHPSDPGRLFVLPLGGEQIFEAGADMESALAWLCESGELTEPIGFKWFESWTNRRLLTFSGPGDLDAVGEALLGLGVHDRVRHVTEEDDPFVELFVPSLQGTVRLGGFDSKVDAFVSHDADIDTGTLQTIAIELERLGLARNAVQDTQ